MSFNSSYVVNSEIPVRVVNNAKDHIHGYFEEPHDVDYKGAIKIFGNKLLDVFDIENAGNGLFVSWHSGNIAYGTSTGEIVRMDSSGNEFARFKPHTGMVNDVLVSEVTGSVYSSSADGTIIKSNGVGAQLWKVSPHTGTANSIAIPNIYRHAETHLYSVGDDMTVKKINTTDGSIVWSENIATLPITGIKTIGSDVYITSGSTLRKLDTDGAIVWETVIPSGGLGVETFNVDNEGFIYCGTRNGDVRKVNAEDGSIVWSYTGTHSVIMRNSRITSMVIDSQGDVFTFGYKEKNRKLDSKGNLEGELDYLVDLDLKERFSNNRVLNATINFHGDMLVITSTNKIIKIDGKTLYEKGYKIVR